MRQSSPSLTSRIVSDDGFSPTAVDVTRASATSPRILTSSTLSDGCRTRLAVLRSRTPELVQQEVWAHLLVHYAVRQLMHHAALTEGLDPDRLSFVGSLRIVRRQLVSHQPFSP